MKFKVNYSDEAKQDLKNILDYVGDILVEPVFAKRLILRLKKSADSLDYMPFRHRVFDVEPWKSQGYRIFNVDKYAILYIPDEAKNTVTIIRIMHGSCKIENHLPIED